MNIHAVVRKSTHILVLTIFTIFFGSHLQAMEESEEFQEKGNIAIPFRDTPYSLKELTTIFNPVLRKPVAVKFNEFFSIMFHGEFPEPKHLPKTIMRGFQCLYDKMVSARKLPAEDQEKEQLNALYQTLALHKDGIAKFIQKLAGDQNLPFHAKVIINESLTVPQYIAEEIKPFKCEFCKKSAEAELGVPDDDSYTNH